MKRRSAIYLKFDPFVSVLKKSPPRNSSVFVRQKPHLARVPSLRPSHGFNASESLSYSHQVMEPLTTASLALLDDASAQSISSRPPRSRAFSFSSISTLTTLPDSDEGEEGDDEESSRSEAEEEEVQPKAKKQRVNNNASKSNSTINQSARKRATGKDEVAKDGKVYLTAGLYWSSGSTADLLKSHSNPPIITKSRSKFIGKGKGKLKEGVEVEAIDWKSFSPSLTLPPPIHFGESLLKKERDFRLPFDILRDRFDNNGTKLAEAILDGKELELKEKSRKPPPFKTISKSLFFFTLL